MSRELDAEIASKLFGLVVHQVKEGDMVFTIHRDFIDAGDYWYHREGWGDDEVPHYSTDIGDAWLVVEKMRGPDFRLNKDGDWVCCFGGTVAFCGEGETAPLAICRAALKAI